MGTYKIYDNILKVKYKKVFRKDNLKLLQLKMNLLIYRSLSSFERILLNMWHSPSQKEHNAQNDEGNTIDSSKINLK